MVILSALPSFLSSGFSTRGDPSLSRNQELDEWTHLLGAVNSVLSIR
jgi:hypothetical protein